MSSPSVRLFCVLCAAIVLPLAPMTLATIGTTRQHPIALDGAKPQPGGAVRTRSGVVVETIRFGDAPAVAASSAEARRRYRNAPAGSEIVYALHDGRIVRGIVANVPADATDVVRRSVLALLALSMTIAGLALGMAGRNRAALSAGGFLSGVGATLGFGFLEPNVVLLTSRLARDAVIAGYLAVPAALWCRYLLLLVAELPLPLPIRRGERAVIGAVSFIALGHAALAALSQLGVLFDRLPPSFVNVSLRLLESSLLQIVPYLATLVTAAILIARQRGALRAAPRESRDRASVIAWGFALGLGVPLLGEVAQFSSLLVLHRLAMPRAAMALLMLPLVLIPLSLGYALLARRVDGASVLAQRALVFLVADRTVVLAGFAPLLVLAAVFYIHRTESIGHFVATRLPLVAALVLLAVLALVTAASIRRALERLFFRRPADSRQALRELAGRAREATDLASFARLLLATVDDALHLESAALFLHDRAHGRLTDADGTLDGIDAASPLPRRAASAAEGVEVGGVTGLERHWVDQRRFRLLLPLFASDHSLLAMLAFGEKMSGLPFDREDRLLLVDLASSAGVMLENLQLRASPSATIPRDTAVALARVCSSCGRVFDPLEAVRCPDDDTPLVEGDIPYLLHGKFRLARRIGAGAMGVVYQAVDLTLGRDVAIKTLPGVSPDDVARFEREARTVAALSHPSIATIYAAESWHGRPMLLFELLEGGTLAQRLRPGPLEPATVISLGVAIADALAHAHAAGVLHRDVKPSNIGFSRDGTPKLLDFGLAHLRGDAISETAGTPIYLSPETILGQPPTPPVDVWSTAVTLYEAATGRHPFAAATTTLTLNRILLGDPIRPDLPPALADVLVHALRRTPQERIGTATELREALAGAMSGVRIYTST